MYICVFVLCTAINLERERKVEDAEEISENPILNMVGLLICSHLCVCEISRGQATIQQRRARRRVVVNEAT